MEKPVQPVNFIYWALSPLVQFGCRRHYRTFTVRGQKNLPTKGGYILAPCHQQALMEPLAVLNITKKSPVFLARADIFAKPTIRKILLFLKIMPVYRIRDGKESLSKNAEIFEKSRSVVLDGYPFCMMAEGKHNNRHQLLPLVKGMFRIAGETQRSLGETPLYIVPTGIDFDEYEEPYANLCVSLGKPIPIQPFMETFETNEPVALNQMRETVSEGMKAQMHHIQSQEHYEEILTLCNILNRAELNEQQLDNTAFIRFLMRKRIANRLDAMEQNNDHQFPKVLQLTRRYKTLCEKLRLNEKTEANHWSLSSLLISLFTIALFLFVTITTRPILWMVLFCLACYPIMVLPTHLIFPKLIKDTQFRSSVNFGARFFFQCIYTLIFSLIMGLTYGGPWGYLVPGIRPFWWWFAAFNLPFLLSYINAPLTCWLRNTWRNLDYWIKRINKSNDIKELDQLRKDLTSIVID